MERNDIKTPKGKAKAVRVRTAMQHQEPDRIPFFEYYWTGFLRKWREELGLPADADPYYYYDIDIVQVAPNIDPVIRPFEILKQTETETVLKTGFGAIIRKVHDFPMPEYTGFETDTIDKVNAFHFDDPWDERRIYLGGDSHIHGVGDDKISRDAPAYIDELHRLAPDFAVFGSMIEASEFMVRSIGQENMMLWIGMYPDEIGKFAERINAYMLELAKAQIKAAKGLLDGFFIAGDVAYAKSMLFSPVYWRKYFKPGVKAIIDLAHENGLPLLYHGCGNVSAILDDFVEIKLDAYHPLETKAGLDAVELRHQMGHRLCFVGNNDVQVWAEGDMDKIKAYTLRKLNAAKGGGYFFGADHSVPNNISPVVYDQIVQLVREHGNYPLQLGEYDIPN